MNEQEKINMLRDFILFLKPDLTDGLIRSIYRTLFDEDPRDPTYSLWNDKHHMSRTEIGEWRRIYIDAMRQAWVDMAWLAY